jgi:hypothetical protein
MWEQLIGTSEGGLGPEVIDLYMEMLNKQKLHNFHFSTCNIFENMNTDYTLLIEYFDKNELFSVDKLFIPLKFGNSWVLVITYIKDFQIDYYDPLNYDGDEITKKFKSFMKELVKKKKHSFTNIRKSTFRSQTIKTVPQKDTLPRASTEFDSGIYILGYIHTLCHNTEFNPSKVRSEISLELLNHLNHWNPLDTFYKNLMTRQAEAIEPKIKEISSVNIQSPTEEKNIPARESRVKKTKKTGSRKIFPVSARRSSTMTEKALSKSFSPISKSVKSKAAIEEEPS